MTKYHSFFMTRNGVALHVFSNLELHWLFTRKNREIINSFEKRCLLDMIR